MTATNKNEGLIARPVRVQLSRKAGWRMPENTVKVDRSTRWGNQIVVGSERGIGFRPWTVEDAVATFRDEMEAAISTDRPDGSDPLDLTPLRGKNLACWCRLDQPCHADVLLELANRPLASPVDGGALRPSASVPAGAGIQGETKHQHGERS